MKSYRLIVHQNRCTVGHFDTNEAATLEGTRVARSMFDVAGSYDCELLVADLEQRVLENGSEGMKILMREVCYRPVTPQI